MAVESVTIIRRGMPLVVDLSVDVPKSETLAVMGPSGAGKTTLLRCIAGLTPLTSGMIRRTPGRLAMVFQDPRLLPWRTARQNVEFVLAPDDRHRAGEWLDRVGLGDAANEYPARLSGGMRQRVAIARALATRAQLILVDEPFSHLDALTAASLRVELSEHLASTGSTAIWITHDPTEAAAVAVRTLELDGPPNGGWRLQ